MTVFDPTYLSDLERRWRGRPEGDWPLVARIALQDFRANDRQVIERCVANLHPDDHPKMIRQLQNQIVTTYGELLAAQVLINAGFEPRYEPTLRTESGVLTPDWCIGGSEPFICDVFTAGLEKSHDMHETALREIEERLLAIPAPYFMAVEMANAAKIDAGGRKKLANEVASWLSTTPAVGEARSFGDMHVEILVIGGDHVDVMTREQMQIIQTPASIFENFDEKAKKYASVGQPLLVIAVKHHRANIDAIDVEDVVLGTSAYVSRETPSGKVVGRSERLHDGVFEKRPGLSAAMFIAPHKQPEPEVRIWSNPLATSPLPVQTLERLAQAKL